MTAPKGFDSDRAITSFAEAVDAVAHHSRVNGQRMTVAEIAERIGRPENYLRKATSQYDDAHPLRGDLIVPLTTATGNFALINYLARACGGVFFQLPDVRTDDYADILNQTATVVGEFGDVLTDLRASLADNRVTSGEAARVAQQGNEAIAEIARLVRMVEDRAAADAVAKTTRSTTRA